MAADLYGRGHPPMTWWQRWTHKRGKHNWRHIADRVWCIGCGKWWAE